MSLQFVGTVASSSPLYSSDEEQLPQQPILNELLNACVSFIDQDEPNNGESPVYDRPPSPHDVTLDGKS